MEGAVPDLAEFIMKLLNTKSVSGGRYEVTISRNIPEAYEVLHTEETKHSRPMKYLITHAIKHSREWHITSVKKFELEEVEKGRPINIKNFQPF